MMDRLLQYKDNDNDNDNERRSFINESIFDIFDEWFDQQSNHHQHASFDRVMEMMIRYCRPKEFLLISLEKLSITTTDEMFRSLLLSIYDVYIKLEPRLLSSFFKDLVNATSKTLGQLIVHTANIDIDIVYMYLDFLNKLMTFVGDLHEENLIVLKTTLVDLVSRLVIFSCDRRRDLIVQVIKTMYSQDVSIMEEILSLNRDKTHLCRDGLTMIASVMMIDYAQGGNLLPRVYSKKYTWKIFLSHLEGVRVEESGCEFIKSLKGILIYNYNDRSFMNPLKMISIIDSADLTNQYDIHCWEHVGCIKRILTVISVADQLTRNEVLVVIRFILLMYDKRSLILLLQQLIVEFDNVPSVAALFIDFLKDMIQHLPNSNVDIISPFSYQFIYDTFIANTFSKIVSDESGWVLAHLDIISATITLAHCIVLRAKQKSDNNNIKDFKVAAMATRVALNKFTVQRNDELKMQLLQYELDYLV